MYQCRTASIGRLVNVSVTGKLKA